MVQMFDEHTWVWDADNDEVIYEDGQINDMGQHGVSSHEVTDIKKSAMIDFIKDFTVEFEQQVIEEFKEQQLELEGKNLEQWLEFDGDYQIIKSVEALEHIKEFKNELTNVRFNPNEDWSVVTDTTRLFSSCDSIESIDCSGFTNVTNAEYMFYDCSSLTSIDCSVLVNVTNAEYMFYDCSSLTYIDCSGFTNVTYAYNMFYNCSPNLQVINGEQLREAGAKF